MSCVSNSVNTAYRLCQSQSILKSCTHHERTVGWSLGPALFSWRCGVGGGLSAFEILSGEVPSDSDVDCKLGKEVHELEVFVACSGCSSREVVGAGMLCLSPLALFSKHLTEDLLCGIAEICGLGGSMFCSTVLLCFCPIFFHIWFALMLDLAALFLVACPYSLQSSLSFVKVAL